MKYIVQLIYIYFSIFLRKILIGCKLKKFFLYPEKIKFLSTKLYKNSNQYLYAKQIIVSKNFEYKFKLFDKQITLNNDFNWDINFTDSEKISALHRWHWLLTNIFNKNKIKYNDGIQAIELWISKFGKNKRVVDSYEISERISNLIIFALYNQKSKNDLSLEILNYLEKNIKILCNQLEFNNDELTGNHLVNNSRALILYGCFVGSTNSINLGFALLKHILPKIIVNDYFLRESSSHYQLLFTSWLIEIFIIINLYKHTKYNFYLSNYLKNLINGCEFFFINKRIVLIGDISPDKTPKWLEDIVKFYNNIDNSDQNIIYTGWAKIISKIKNYKKIKISKLNNQKKINKKIQLFKESGYCKFTYGKWILFMHIEEKSDKSIASHAHHDFLSFALYYNSMEFLLDVGRLNYSNSTEGIYGKKAKAHNSIIINNFKSSYSKADRHIPSISKIKKTMFKVNDYNDHLKLEIKHNGFKKNIKNLEFHKRIIKLYKKKFIVEDFLIGNDSCEVENYFHWSDNVSLLKNKNKIYLKSNFTSTNSIKLYRKFYRGSKKPFIGWNFKSYGHKRPITTEVIKNKCKLPAKLSFQFNIG